MIWSVLEIELGYLLGSMMGTKLHQVVSHWTDCLPSVTILAIRLQFLLLQTSAGQTTKRDACPVGLLCHIRILDGQTDSEVASFMNFISNRGVNLTSGALVRESSWMHRKGTATRIHTILTPSLVVFMLMYV